MLRHTHLNEYVLNKCALLSQDAINEAGYKRGVARPEVLGYAHSHGGQIQTLKKKLHKLNANAQYTIVAMSRMTKQYSVYDILATLFIH